MSERLVVSRLIRASPARLFAAWTEREQLAAWWGPDGVRCVHAEIDARQGGLYRIDNEMPDGRVLTIRGAFLEVVEASRLVFTWALSEDAPEERVTVRFEPEGRQGHTRVTVEHERIPDAERREGHEQGWLGCLEGLAEHAR